MTALGLAGGGLAVGALAAAHHISGPQRPDLAAAIDWAAERRPGSRISLLGFSMGAATSILVAARDRRVERVLADSPFADIHGVIASAARGMHLPPVPLALVDLVTGLRYGCRFREVQPVDVVAEIAPRPLLIIHGTQDHVIPVEHAHRLADAAGDGCELRIVDGVDHCGAYFADRPGYIERAAGFLGL